LNFFWFLVVVGLVIWAFRIIRGFKRKIDSLQKTVGDLEGRLWLLERKLDGEPVEEVVQDQTPEVPVKEETPAVAQVMRPIERQAVEEMAKATVEVAETAITPAIPEREPESVPRPVSEPKGPSRLGEFWKVVESRFAENWTGVLGSMIMVMGISFLGIYTALKMAPVYRFGMLVVVAAVLGGLYFVLRHRAKWEKLASWLRSSGGAVFLFACVGAGGIPGLQWAQSAMIALILLVAGVAVNSYLAYIGGTQVFASLHVLLSLMALAIAPANAITLVVAAIVTLIGIAITYREQWEYHLLLTIGLFFAFHLYWYLEIGASAMSGTTANTAGLLSVLAVGVAALLVHYREIYSTESFARVPFMVHFFNWGFMGFGLYLHSTGSQWKPLIIGAGAAASFVLARLARKKGIRWLYVTDTLVAQVIAMIALATISGWGVQWIHILGIVFIECSIFMHTMIREKETLLGKTGAWLVMLAGLAMLSLGFSASADNASTDTLKRYGLSLMVCSVWAAGLLIYFIERGRKLKPADGEKPLLDIPRGVLYFSPFYFLGTSAFLTGISWGIKPFLFLVLVFLTFFTAKWAKIRGMSDIFPTVCFFSQMTATLAVYSLGTWDINFYFLMGLAFVETLLFYSWMMKEEARSIWGYANFWVVASGILLLLPGIFDALDRPGKHWFTEFTITLVGAAIACAIFYIYAKSSPLERPKLRAVSWLPALMLLAAFLKIANLTGTGYLFALLGVGLLLVRQRYHSTQFALATLFYLVAFHIIGWDFIERSLPQPAFSTILAFIPLVALSFFSFKLSHIEKTNKFVRWPGIYLLGANIIFFSYYLLQPVSKFLPGLAWLLAGAVILVVVDAYERRLGEKVEALGYTGRYWLHVGYFLLAAFLFRHVTGHIAWGQMVSGFKIRVMVALLGIVVFAFLALRKTSESAPQYKSRKRLYPLFLEVFLFFTGATIVMEMRLEWQPLALAALALAALKSDRILPQRLTRLKFYSLILFWISGILVIRNAWEFITPQTNWHESIWFCAAATLILQFLYSILIAEKGILQNITFPTPTKWLDHWLSSIKRRMNPWIYYPLFAALALFLYFSFAKALLTLLWVVECFIIFILGLLLKENHFRIVSMSGLGLALARLVFYDMAKTDTLTRALVFIGVGVIMLAMNSLYNKYKDRF
jgi:hypothetical protein